MENKDFKDTTAGVKAIRKAQCKKGTLNCVFINGLTLAIKSIMGFKREIVFNTSKPEGTMRKLNDVSNLNSLGWRPTIALKEGVKRAYHWYKRNADERTYS